MSYIRLSGFGSARQKRLQKTVWVGPDHLLIAERLGCEEDYTRVFYKDIRGVVVQRDRRNWIILFLVVAVSLLRGKVVGIGILIWFVATLFKRQCVCVIVTDVQSIRLPVPSLKDDVRRFVQFLQERSLAVPRALIEQRPML